MHVCYVHCTHYYVPIFGEKPSCCAWLVGNRAAVRQHIASRHAATVKLVVALCVAGDTPAAQLWTLFQ